MHANEERTNYGRGLTRWEMNAFWAMSVLAGAFLMLLVGFVIPRLLAPVLGLPLVVWAFLAFLVLGLAQYPVRRTEARLAQPTREISFKRFLIAMLLGSAVGALVFLALGAILGPY
jgi:uncharacterized membrane protein YdjX (TVP38/TMEM64 family)